MNKSIKITIPENLSEITLGQFIEYNKVVKNLEGNVDNAFYRCKVVSIFCKLPFEVVRKNVRATDLQSISDEILTLLNNPPTYDNKQPMLEFTLGKTQFGFIPDFVNISAGEFADLTEYIKDWDTMHKAMAIMYRPITSAKKSKVFNVTQYEIEEYETSAKYSLIMMSLPLDKAFRASFFLISSFNKLRIRLLQFLEREVRMDNKLHTQLKSNLQLSGAGIQDSLSFLAKELSTLTELPK